MKNFAIIAAAALAPAVVNAQAAAWAQCGGQGFSGATTCVSGYTCQKTNDYYSQCVPGTASAAPSSSAATSRAPSTVAGTSTKPTSTGATRTTLVTSASPATTGGAGTPAAGNPLAGYTFYANPYYSSEVVSLAIPSMIAEGKTALAAKASAVANIGTFYWLDVAAKVPSIAALAADVQKKNAAGAKLTLPLVVYDLPNRDCAALASNGELSIANNGAALYQQYIDAIAAQIKAYPDVKFTLVYEPDSLANLVTNLNVQKCADAEAVYKSSAVYAMKALNLPNVVMYLDAGHGGWLGWSANIGPAAQLFGDLYKQAGSPAEVRGLATNVANYNAWSIATCPSYTQGNANCDEKRYINALAPLLTAQGFPAHFIVDQGRSGVQPTKQQQQGDWCNVIGTGFGIRPTTSTDDPLLDAFVWVKPGGEGDGTSNSSSPRYDSHCGLSDALQPAPEAGTWFEAYFEQLLTNANPAF